jgi:hypothetical protein
MNNHLCIGYCNNYNNNICICIAALSVCIIYSTLSGNTLHVKKNLQILACMISQAWSLGVKENEDVTTFILILSHENKLSTGEIRHRENS